MRRIIFSLILALVLMPGLSLAVSDLEIVSFDVYEAPEVIVVGEEFEITLQKVIHNAGPDGPVNASLTTSILAPTGASVFPISMVVSVEDLDVGENRTVLESFMLTVGQAGLNTFTFINEISNVIDPDPTNNSASLNFDIIAAPVPEPATLTLLGLGLAGLAVIRRRKE